jgi:hypothetical protein
VHLYRLLCVAGVVVFGGAAAVEGATIIDFETLSHGRIVTAQYSSTGVGVTINAVNYGSGASLAVAFDTAMTNTPDPDLEGTNWSGGNIPAGTNLGKVLIIPANGIDANNDGRIDVPDDEGNRPAGYFRFKFNQHIHSFGFDLLDVETEEFNSTSGYVALYDNANLVGRVGWGELVDPLSPHYQRGIAWGGKSANRVAPLTSLDFGGKKFNTVILNMGGSGAIDNIVFDETLIPEPAVASLLAIGAMGLLRRRRR